MVPGFDDAKAIEMRARLDDRLGLWAVTYLLFFVKLGPGTGAVLGPCLRHLDRLAMAVPERVRPANPRSVQRLSVLRFGERADGGHPAGCSLHGRRGPARNCCRA